MKKQKYIVSKIAEVLKFVATLGFIAFLISKTPDQAAQIVSMAAAFIVGGSTKLGSKFGF